MIHIYYLYHIFIGFSTLCQINGLFVCSLCSMSFVSPPIGVWEARAICFSHVKEFFAKQQQHMPAYGAKGT